MTEEVLSPAEAPKADPAPGVGDNGSGRENGGGALSRARADLLAYFGAPEANPASQESIENETDHILGIVAAHLADSHLPVATLRDALPYLRRPFAAPAIRWKVQSQFGGVKKKDGKGYEEGKPPHSAQIAPYINAPTVVDLLNTVTGDLWQDAYESVSNGVLRCHLTIDGVTRSDVGDGGLTKAGHSDALKRAAMRFGVGVFLRATPRIVLRNGGESPKPNQLKQLRNGNLALTDANLDALCKGYERWLEREGTKFFGEAFDFGDVVDALGDPDDQVEHEPVPEDVDAQTGEVKPTGRKIKKARLEEIVALVESAPSFVSGDQLAAKLDELGVPAGDLLERHKQLREGQADQYEAWLKGASEEPSVPEVE